MKLRGIASAIALAALALGSSLPATAEHQEFDPDCTRGAQGGSDEGRPIRAHFVQPENGKLVVETQVGAADLAGLPIDTGVMVSTTGEITVEIEHDCVQHLLLTVTKGDDVIHTNSFDTDCTEGTTEDTVEIGLDAGEFEFHLEGQGCNHGPLVPSSDGHYVGDPPLGLPPLQRI